IIELQPPANVDGRHDLSPQVDQAADHRRCERHPRHLRVTCNFLHLQHVETEIVPANVKRAVLAIVIHRQDSCAIEIPAAESTTPSSALLSSTARRMPSTSSTSVT